MYWPSVYRRPFHLGVTVIQDWGKIRTVAKRMTAANATFMHIRSLCFHNIKLTTREKCH